MNRSATPCSGLRTPHFPSPKARHLLISTGSPEPINPFAGPTSPILYPKSAPAHRKQQVSAGSGNYARNRSLSLATKDKVNGARHIRHIEQGGSNVSEPQKLSPPKSLLDVTTLYQLQLGQHALKAQLQQHEVVLRRLRHEPWRTPKDHAFIQEIREHSRKSARKLWTRSETPNGKVPPIVFSQTPTPRAHQNHSVLGKREETMKNQREVSIEMVGVVGTVAVQHRFPRNIFMRKRRV